MANCFSQLAALRALAGAMGPIFLQLVVQSFQADAENVCGARLIVIGSFQSFQDEQALGFAAQMEHAALYRITLTFKTK